MPVDFIVEPPRLHFVNVDAPDSNDTLSVQFNPTQFQMDIQAVYSRPVIPGQSYQPMQYSHTSNMVIPLELFFRVTNPSNTGTPVYGAGSAVEDSNASAQLRALRSGTSRTLSKGSGVSRPFTLADRDTAEKWLLSTAYPQAGDGIISAAPPRVLVVWPQYVSLVCKVTSLSFRPARFNREAQAVVETIQVVLEQFSEIRFTSEQARLDGFQQSDPDGYGVV